MKNYLYKTPVVLISFGLILLCYQNCGNFKSGLLNSGDQASSAVTTPESLGDNPFLNSEAINIIETPYGPVNAAIPLKDSIDGDFTVGSQVRYVAWDREAQVNNPGPLQTDAQYVSVLSREFDTMIPGNEFKISGLQYTRGNFRFQRVGPIASIANNNNQKIHGHTFLWHSYNPPWVVNLSGVQDTQSAIRDHISTVIRHFDENQPGLITGWDVVNEAIDYRGQVRPTMNNPWARMNSSSEDPYEYIDYAFRVAHEANSEVDLYYNDFAIEGLDQKSDGLYRMIEDLQARGTPIHGIGFQAHFQVDNTTTNAPSYESIRSNFERFAQLGMKIRISEFDVRIKLDDGVTQTERDLQADIFYRVTRACVDVPACNSINFWGFTDGDTWITRNYPGYGEPLLFDENYNPKQSYHAVQAALQYGKE